MGNDEEMKILTFAEAANINIKENEFMRRRAMREVRLLEEAFPDTYKDNQKYKRCQDTIDSLTRYIDLNARHASYFARLDEVLEKLLQRVHLKPLDYGYELMRQSKANNRPCMRKIASWDHNNMAIDHDHSWSHISEISVFNPSALYFEFPGYSGAILYMDAFAQGKPGSIIMRVGLQVVDNIEAYRIYRKDYPEYATIETSNFQPYYKDKCFKSAFSAVPEELDWLLFDLSLLNTGYVEGVWQILTGIIKDGYMDLFGFEEEK